MKIRQANEEELLQLWEEDKEHMSPTTSFFYSQIKNGTAEFWTYEHEGKLVGELYAFKELEDKEFANGKDRAYLCAFRIIKELRGKGYGTKLMNHVINHLKEEGFKTITIGVDEIEEDNQRLYHRVGFLDKIKDCTLDPCGRDEIMQPVKSSKFWLLKKTLLASLVLMTVATGCGKIDTPKNTLMPEITTNQAYEFNDRYFHVITDSEDSKKVYVCYSNDKGENWNNVLLQYGSSVSDYEFTFLDEKEGYLIIYGGVGAGMAEKALYHTQDGGESWTLQAATDCEDNSVGKIYYSHLSGIGYGANGLVIASERFRGTGVDNDPVITWSHDYGVTWEEFTVELPRTQIIEKYGLTMESDEIAGEGKTAYIDGDKISLPIEILLPDTTKLMYYVSENGGIDWTLQFDDEFK